MAANGSATQPDKGESSEPGSLAERPMGNDPPPKNEDLADDVAPTFEVQPLLIFQTLGNQASLL